VYALTGPDGSVYVSDDFAGNIYRVTYNGPRITPNGIVRRSAQAYELYGSNLVGTNGDFAIFAAGVQMQTLYVSPSQVNFLMPDDWRGDVPIAVRTDKAIDEAVVHVE